MHVKSNGNSMSELGSQMRPSPSPWSFLCPFLQLPVVLWRVKRHSKLSGEEGRRGVVEWPDLKLELPCSRNPLRTYAKRDEWSPFSVPKSRVLVSSSFFPSVCISLERGGALTLNDVRHVFNSRRQGETSRWSIFVGTDLRTNQVALWEGDFFNVPTAWSTVLCTWYLTHLELIFIYHVR